MPIDFNILNAQPPKPNITPLPSAPQLPQQQGGGIGDLLSGLASAYTAYKNGQTGQVSTPSTAPQTYAQNAIGMNPAGNDTRSTLEQQVSQNMWNTPAFQTGLQAHQKAVDQGITTSPVMTVVDYSIPSNQQRMFVVDTNNKKLLMSTYVAQGATPGFSNTPNSHQSSLGTYSTGQTYLGKNGDPRMQVNGLEPGVNDNAFSRAIVVHGGSYVGPDKNGTSWGCFAVPNSDAPKLIGLTSGGTIIHAYAPDQQSMSNFSKTLTPQGASHLQTTLNNSDQHPDLNNVVSGIVGVESGGNFNAISKPSSDGDRAYGYSQIMGKNIPSWTKAALGYPMTPQQYLNNPVAQQKTTAFHVNNLLKQGYSPQDVASIWFSGRPQSKAGNARDAYGTTVPQYINSFNKHYLNSRENNQPSNASNLKVSSNQNYDINKVINSPTVPGVQNIPAFNNNVPIRNLSPQEQAAIMKNLHAANSKSTTPTGIPSNPIGSQGINWNLFNINPTNT